MVPCTFRSARPATCRQVTALRIPRVPPSCGIPPGGGPAQPFATGVRNGTGLAIAPDGSVWTTVNNRDNVAVPDAGPSYGQVVGDYVGDHPPESIVKLTPGRELGWPYCNPDGGSANLPLTPRCPDQRRRQQARLRRVTARSNRSMARAFRPRSGLEASSDGALPEPYAHGALVGVHGSWTVKPPAARRGVLLPLEERKSRQSADP